MCQNLHSSSVSTATWCLCVTSVQDFEGFKHQFHELMKDIYLTHTAFVVGDLSMKSILHSRSCYKTVIEEHMKKYN